MKKFNNEKGNIIEYLLMLLLIGGTGLYFTIKMFAGGKWIIGIILTLFVLLPLLGVLLAAIVPLPDDEKSEEDKLSKK